MEAKRSRESLPLDDKFVEPTRQFHYRQIVGRIFDHQRKIPTICRVRAKGYREAWLRFPVVAFLFIDRNSYSDTEPEQTRLCIDDVPAPVDAGERNRSPIDEADFCG